MNFLRVAVAVIGGFGAALVAYAIIFTHGNPRPEQGDPALAFRLLPLELLLGLLVGILLYRGFGRRLGGGLRTDIAERMVLRVAHRQGGRFSVEDVIQTSPLGEEQAREALGRLVASGQVLSDDGGGAGRYRIGR
jgi:hypothetical protein